MPNNSGFSKDPRRARPERRAAGRGMPAEAAFRYPGGVSATHRELVDLTLGFITHRVAELDEDEAARLIRRFERTSEDSGRMGVLLGSLGVGRSSTSTTPEKGKRSGQSLAARIALEVAMGRALTRKREILSQRGMLNGESAAERLGVSRQTIHARTRAGLILALEFGKRGLRYPEWQFDDAIAGDPLAEVLAALAELEPWTRYRFFMQPQPALAGRTPIEALRSGDRAATIRAARVWSRGEQGGG